VAKTTRTAPLAKGLSVSRSKIEQWVGRGIVQPDLPTVSGSARDWTFFDAKCVAMIAEFSDAGLPLERLSPYVHAFRESKGTDAFLVLVHGVDTLVPPAEPGAKGTPAEDSIRTRVPGTYRAALLRTHELAEFLSDPDHVVSIVISLGAIERRVEKIWDDISTED
jgi:hypothetical protein